MSTPPAFPRLPEPGEPAPWFTADRLGADKGFAFHKLGGKHVLLLFFGSAGQAATAAALAEVARAERLFDNVRAVFFGVSVDPQDVTGKRISGAKPTINFFLDPMQDVSRMYGAAAAEHGHYRPYWLLLDPLLRVVGRFPIAAGAQAIAALAAEVERPQPDLAPVLQVPNVLAPDLCRRLVELYEADGGQESGVMRQVDGRTTYVADRSFKRRRDCTVEDPALQGAIRHSIQRRLVPMIHRAFAFEATRIERYIVACYDAADEGVFNAHRDNTTSGTAHRRFAVTINLNDDYEGGDLRFPEWGTRTYRAPAGGAVVFSCSMLHEATTMRRGRRYATLPFLYDDAAAAVRSANLHAVDPAPERVTAGAGSA